MPIFYFVLLNHSDFIFIRNCARKYVRWNFIEKFKANSAGKRKRKSDLHIDFGSDRKSSMTRETFVQIWPLQSRTLQATLSRKTILFSSTETFTQVWGRQPIS